MNYIIAIDQSTSATKAMLFDEQCHLLARADKEHRQYYPQTGWVEHDAEEIFNNMVEVIRQVVAHTSSPKGNTIDSAASNSSEAVGGAFSLCITNQRETVVVWNRHTGKPISRAVVWQDTRGKDICNQLRVDGQGPLVLERAGLLIDPNFSAPGVKWLLDNIEGAREAAASGDLLMGTIDTWLVWKLTGGRVHATDTTNASRTMLFNIHTLQWDDDLLRLFDIPRSMMPEVKACDAIYGETTVEGLFAEPITIAGMLGDSHGALVGQMCFDEGMGKVTYGTGSSVMVNIGEKPLPAPDGLVTSVGFSAFGKTWYGYEGNIYSTGATLKWIADQLQLVGHPKEMEALATSVADNGGVYIVPAFSGLGAPWWQSGVKGAVFGLTFATTKAHFLRAALESIAYQIKDLVDVMARATGAPLKEIAADGGPTKNRFLMQFQADMLSTPVVCTEVEDASAFGAVLMNGFARGLWQTFDEVAPLRKVTQVIQPQSRPDVTTLYDGWRRAVEQLIR
ncbi:MAG: glycerol kinase GlpK [Prevotella sp.]|nr:glycerol kinase GlpK [Prevotella sp.]